MGSTTFLGPETALAAESLAKNPHLEYRSALPPKKLQQDPAVAKILEELKAWCEQEHGRQTEVAKVLGVDHRRLYDWFSGRIEPSWGVGLRIQAFLAKKKRARRSGGKPDKGGA
jgi:hypothetical protein